MGIPAHSFNLSWVAFRALESCTRRKKWQTYLCKRWKERACWERSRNLSYFNTSTHPTSRFVKRVAALDCWFWKAAEIITHSTRKHLPSERNPLEDLQSCFSYLTSLILNSIPEQSFDLQTFLQSQFMSEFWTTKLHLTFHRHGGEQIKTELVFSGWTCLPTMALRRDGLIFEE